MSEGPYRYLWVVDFPLFDGVDDAGHPVAAHHPFTMPHPDDLDRLESDPGLGPVPGLRPGPQRVGAGIGQRPDPPGRHPEPGLLRARASARRRPQSRFGFLLGAFRYGAPPHAGFAVGIDRLVAIFAGEDNIREVIAFPKTQSGSDPMTGAPKPLAPGVPGATSGSSPSRPKD